MLAATRSFEFVALLLAWGIAAVVFGALRLSERTWSAQRTAAGVAVFVATTVAVYLATGKRDLFFLYGNHLDRQSGDVLGAEIAETPTLSPATVPVKLVQLLSIRASTRSARSRTTRRAEATGAISISGASRSLFSCPRSFCSRCA